MNYTKEIVEWCEGFIRAMEFCGDDRDCTIKPSKIIESRGFLELKSLIHQYREEEIKNV